LPQSNRTIAELEHPTVPRTLEPSELRPFYRSLYADAARPQRLLAVWRPSISPIAPIARFVPAGASALDIGCGSGGLLLLLAATGRIGQGVGCDISETAIRAAVAAGKRLVTPAVEFRRTNDFSDVPRGPFDTVLMIDVLHHIPPARQREAVVAAAERVAAGGALIYKDMASRPAWRRWANTLHDLLLARQLVSHVPIAEVEHWMRQTGFSVSHAESYSRYAYGHELRVFRRPP
jgi:2-polyprenyl-3-methyl-5-hydroxy-6-metoxy-1,4-benzoquinol methylase